MDQYKHICYLETLRKNIWPTRRIKSCEKNKIYICLGSIIFFKDNLLLNKSNNNFDSNDRRFGSDEILLKCAIYKNNKKITNEVEVKIKNNKVKEIYYGKYKPSTPTYRNYKNFNGSNVTNRRIVKFKVVRNKILTTIKKRVRLESINNNKWNDNDDITHCKSRLRAPIIVNINSVLAFKLRRLRSVLKNRLNDCLINLSIDLYVNNIHISTNKRRISIGSSELSTSNYDADCIILYSRGVSSGSGNKKSICSNSDSKECCCNVENKILCYKHISEIVELIANIIGTSNFGSNIRSSSIKYGKYMLYRYLQILYYLVSANKVNSCCDVSFPISMMTFRTVGSTNSNHNSMDNTDDDNNTNNHNYDIVCKCVNEILFKHTRVLSIDNRDLLFIEIPSEFKVLQLLYRSSLLSINTDDKSKLEEHKIKMFDKWYTYNEINGIVYKSYEQLSRSPNSICLLLRFTNYNDKKQYLLLKSYLDKLDSMSDGVDSTKRDIGVGTTSDGINMSDDNRDSVSMIGNSNDGMSIGSCNISTNVMLELISSDFSNLNSNIRRKIISIVIKNLKINILRRFFRQFLFFLKYDIDDTFFSYILKTIENDLGLSFKMYYFLLSFCFTTISYTDSYYTRCSIFDNNIYLDYLKKYINYLSNVNNKILNLNKLEVSFLRVFLDIINKINKTRKRYTLRNYYLNLLFNRLAATTNNNSKDTINVRLSLDREKKVINVEPYVPLITDVNYLIKSIDYEKSHIYKSSNYPLILHLITTQAGSSIDNVTSGSVTKGKSSNKVDGTMGDGVMGSSTNDNKPDGIANITGRGTSGTTTTDSNASEIGQRIMLKMNYIGNDELCVDVLNLFKIILKRYKIPVLTYKLISIYKNLGYIQFLSNIQGWDSSGDDYIGNKDSSQCRGNGTSNKDGDSSEAGGSVDGTMEDGSKVGEGTSGTNIRCISSSGKRGSCVNGNYGVGMIFKDNFINSFSVISILNYLLEVGDRHYENVLLQRNGVVTNFDFNYIFGNDPNTLKKPPFRFSSGDLDVLKRLGAYNEFVNRFTFIFSVLRRNYKHVLNLLYTSGVDIVDVHRVEERFMLDLSSEELKEQLFLLIKQSQNSYYPQFIDKWHQFTNLFK